MKPRSKAQFNGFALVAGGYLIIMIALLRALVRILPYATQAQEANGMGFLLLEIGILAGVLAAAIYAIRRGFALIRESMRD